jgi:Zn finger protein HypA/HybF involved in hydrogenase expression
MASKKTLETYLRQFKLKHGDNFDYTLVTDICNNQTKVAIKCNTCFSIFNQSVNSHSMGHGCPKCRTSKQSASVIKMKEAQFKQKVGLRHKFKYTYDNVKYTGHREKVSITCSEHGDFMQTPRDHLAGQGCPKCGIFGYKKKDFIKRCGNNQGLLYIIRCYTEQENFIKIGITSKSCVRDRYRGNLKMPYSYEILWELRANAANIYNKEKYIHSLLKAYSCKPNIKFSGMFECFTLDCLEHIKYEL